VVPSRKACTISDCATLGSSVQRLEKRRMKSRSGRQLSVRNVVLTLTSSKRQGLSLDGRC
jgi:hypothetical protein